MLGIIEYILHNSKYFKIHLHNNKNTFVNKIHFITADIMWLVTWAARSRVLRITELAPPLWIIAIRIHEFYHWGDM